VGDDSPDVAEEVGNLGEEAVVAVAKWMSKLQESTLGDTPHNASPTRRGNALRIVLQQLGNLDLLLLDQIDRCHL
jgi:hypothetical protein